MEPQFILRQEYEARQRAIEKRVDQVEVQLTEQDKRITKIIADNLQWVNENFSDIKQLVTLQSEKTQQQISNLQINSWKFIATSLISLLAGGGVFELILKIGGH
mgnify:CR=1 FL=1